MDSKDQQFTQTPQSSMQSQNPQGVNFVAQSPNISSSADFDRENAHKIGSQMIAQFRAQEIQREAAALSSDPNTIAQAAPMIDLSQVQGLQGAVQNTITQNVAAQNTQPQFTNPVPIPNTQPQFTNPVPIPNTQSQFANPAPIPNTQSQFTNPAPTQSSIQAQYQALEQDESLVLEQIKQLQAKQAQEASVAAITRTHAASDPSTQSATGALTPQQVLALAGQAHSSMPTAHGQNSLYAQQTQAATVANMQNPAAQAPAVSLPSPQINTAPIAPAPLPAQNVPHTNERRLQPIHDERMARMRAEMQRQMAALLGEPVEEVAVPSAPAATAPVTQNLNAGPTRPLPRPASIQNPEPSPSPVAPSSAVSSPAVSSSTTPSPAASSPVAPNSSPVADAKSAAEAAIIAAATAAAASINAPGAHNRAVTPEPASNTEPKTASRPKSNDDTKTNSEADELPEADVTIADLASLPAPIEIKKVKAFQPGYISNLEEELREDLSSGEKLDQNSMAARMAAELADDDLTQKALKQQ